MVRSIRIGPTSFGIGRPTAHDSGTRWFNQVRFSLVTFSMRVSWSASQPASRSSGFLVLVDRPLFARPLRFSQSGRRIKFSAPPKKCPFPPPAVLGSSSLFFFLFFFFLME